MEKYGYKFVIEKIKGSCWKVSSMKYYLKVSEGKTKKEAVDNALKILEKEGKESIAQAFDNARRKVVKNKFFDKMQPIFYSIFGHSIPIDGSMLAITGTKCIDIVGFDHSLHTPDGISTSNHIANKYGSLAKKLVEKLI